MSQMTAKRRPASEELHGFNPIDNETKIIAFSGKLGSGKTSCANFLHTLAFTYALQLTEHSFVSPEGKLVVKFGDNDYRWINLDSKDPEDLEYLATRVWPFMKKYSCADPLKRICVDVLGLDEKLVYGSQTDKQTETHLRWQDMPTKVEFLVQPTDPIPEGDVKEEETQHIDKNKNKKTGLKYVTRTGPMTVRDVLEYVGTQLFRKMYPDCWAEALVKTIIREKPLFAIVDDVRFPNELTAIKNAGGKIIRLTRETAESKANNHISNVALDNAEFDYVINNDDCLMDDTFRQLMVILTEIGWFKVVN